VPSEFKGRNQIEAGFESLFFWWSTVNKMSIGLIIFIITNKLLFTIPEMPSKE
jgi:hypothetical protein